MGVIDRIRLKMEAIEAKISKASAKVQSKVRTQRVNYLDNQGEAQMHKKSSWVRAFAFDKKTKTLYMTTHQGKTYSWPDIPDSLAIQVLNGLASCTTDDPSGKNRWFIGKSPSLGAAFWQLLKPLTRMNVKTPPTVMDYMDILNEGYETRYNVDITKKRGRPTKSLRDARDFGWTNRYKGVKS
jgi:hypothetical protein